MTEFEKAELLTARANVSFEEARDALKACGGSLVDAMVYLERLGHSKQYTRPLQDPRPYYDYEHVYPGRKTSCGFWGFLKKLFRKSVDNDLVVSQNGIEKFRMPVLAFVILLFMFSMVTLVAMAVSLCFGVTYSFQGKDDLSKVNSALSAAGSRAATMWQNSHLSYEINELCRKYDAEEKKNGPVK